MIVFIVFDLTCLSFHGCTYSNLSTYMEGIFPGYGIFVFESVQQWTVEWVHCALSSGVNVYIPHLINSKNSKSQIIECKN